MATAIILLHRGIAGGDHLPAPDPPPAHGVDRAQVQQQGLIAVAQMDVPRFHVQVQHGAPVE